MITIPQPRFMKIFILTAIAALFLVNCKQNDSNTANKDPKIEKSVAQNKKNYTLTPFTPSKAYQDAAIEEMTYKAGKFNFKLNDSPYKLGMQTSDAPQKMCANSAKGQHIHLIVDNNPYIAKYTNAFDHEIKNGDHHILAFLSRSYHESIKTDKAFTAIEATIKDNTIQKQTRVPDPMVFYSRPKGTYVGADTKKVMLDYYLVNDAQSSKYKVRAKINEEVHILDKWQPYYIEGLPMGDNTIELTLIDDSGKAVDTPLNPVSRTFTLKADPLENNG